MQPAAFPQPTSRQAPTLPPQGDHLMKTCPHCGKSVPDYTTRCKYCDEPIPIFQPVSSAESVALVCPSCGASLDYDTTSTVVSCAYCGNRVVVPAVRSNTCPTSLWMSNPCRSQPESSIWSTRGARTRRWTYTAPTLHPKARGRAIAGNPTIRPGPGCSTTLL